MPLYRISIFKSWESRVSERRWVNSYEFSSGAVGPEDLSIRAQALAGAERILHMNPVQFLEAVISTWEPDSSPYDPTSFLTVPLVGVGDRVPGVAQPLDLNVAYYVARQAVTGRSGKLFYRGCLHEGDVETGSDGHFRLTTGGAMASGGATWISYAAEMDSFVNPTDGTQLSLIGVYGTPPGAPVVRAVTAVSPKGVVINRRNHRYYDVA